MGEGTREQIAAFAQVEIPFGDRVRVTAGIRYDRIDDQFEDPVSGFAEGSTLNDAFSPRLGVAWRPYETITVWANAGRSFKAPTPFQLFDQRLVFGLFPITNPNLKPQRGDSFSLGYRHLIDGIVDVSATYYQHDLEDEIGFDFDAFQTANIASSRHRGYEVEIGAPFLEDFRAAVTYTLNDAEVRSGDFTGNQIEQVPRAVTTLALSWARGPWSASAFGRDVRGVFLDGANTIQLDRYNPVDLVAAREFGRFAARLEVKNAFDQEYATWGFANPVFSGSPGEPRAFTYPSPDRAFLVSLVYRGGARR